MARRSFSFGASEELKCLDGLKRFEIETDSGAVDVCYAARVVTDSIFLPWRIYVKDYVFSKDGDTYYVPSEDNINYFQANGELPNTIPEYSLTKVDIVSGNFLWIGLGFLLLYVGISSFFEKDETKVKD